MAAILLQWKYEYCTLKHVLLLQAQVIEYAVTLLYIKDSFKNDGFALRGPTITF